MDTNRSRRALEIFQSEIGRRILKFSLVNQTSILIYETILKLGKYHNDLAPIIGLHLPSIKARILLRKLCFLSKLLENEDDEMSSRLFRTLSAENVYSISLVEQCKWLQNEISTDPVHQQCLLEPATTKAIVRRAKEDILKRDWIKTLESARKHQSLKYITCTDFAAASCMVQTVVPGHRHKRYSADPMFALLPMSSCIWGSPVPTL